MFIIILGLVVLAVAFFHYTQGFFSAAISAILCVFSAVLAISYHETIVETFLGGAMANYAHGATVLVLFATIYLVCRVVFDKLVPGNVTLPAGADKAGAGVMGLIAGFFAAGVCAFAAQSMAFQPALMGYSRFAYEDERDASIPQEGGRNVSINMYDSINSAEPLHLAEADQQSLIIPADDILIDIVKTLSDNGALASRPLEEVHPNWLNELYGQRLGIQSAYSRVAMNKPDGTQKDLIAIPDEEHKDAGVYVLDRQLPQKIAEFGTVARVQRDKTFPKNDPKSDPGKLTIVLRVYFGEKAKDTKDAIIRFSMSSVRLVTQKKVPGTGEMEWTNYYPMGTIEEGTEFWFNRPDDFLFIDDREKSEGVNDKGVDLVFQVEREGFLKAANVPDATQTAISDGTFIELKRMARVDLSGQPIQPMAKLKPSKAIQVLRKTLVKKPPKVNEVQTPDPETSNPETPDPETSEAPEKRDAPATADKPPPTPAPVPAKPQPAPAAMANDTSLVVVDLYDNFKFYTPIRIPGGSTGEVQVPGGTVTLEESKIRALNLAPTTQEQLNAGTGEPVNRLAEGTGSMMVHLECTPGAEGGGWAWKDKVAQIAAVDRDGKKYFPNGVWAVVEGNKVVARFNADGVVNLSDYTPTGAPSKIFFAYTIPEGQQIVKVQVGDALLKQFPAPLP